MDPNRIPAVDLSAGFRRPAYNALLLAAVAQARSCNEQQDLSRVRIDAHDEIFQSGQPVLVGVDADSTYCYLLSLLTPAWQMSEVDQRETGKRTVWARLRDH